MESKGRHTVSPLDPGGHPSGIPLAPIWNAIGLLSLLDKDSRYSPSLMCAAYDAILEEAMRRNGDVLSRRLKMGLYRKLQFALGMIRKPRINLFSGNL